MLKMQAAGVHPQVWQVLLQRRQDLGHAQPHGSSEASNR